MLPKTFAPARFGLILSGLITGAPDGGHARRQAAMNLDADLNASLRTWSVTLRRLANCRRKRPRPS